MQKVDRVALVDRGDNPHAVVAIHKRESADNDSPAKFSEVRGRIAKIDDDKRLVFGWAYVSKIGGEQVTDHSGDFVVDVAKDLEDAVYDYVLHSREGDQMHTARVTSRLVESIVWTPEKYTQLGITKSKGLLQGWWVGFKVEDEEVWKKVKSGELAMFSISGQGTREQVTDSAIITATEKHEETDVEQTFAVIVELAEKIQKVGISAALSQNRQLCDSIRKAAREACAEPDASDVTDADDVQKHEQLNFEAARNAVVAKVDKLARQLQDQQPAMSFEHAKGRIWKSRPDLYHEYDAALRGHVQNVVKHPQYAGNTDTFEKLVAHLIKALAPVRDGRVDLREGRQLLAYHFPEIEESWRFYGEDSNAVTAHINKIEKAARGIAG